MSRSSFAEILLARLLKWLPGLLVCALLLANALGPLTLSSLRQIDANLHDFRLRLFARETHDDRVAIVAIDEKSLAELGRWPWSRDRLAALVDALFTRHGAALVGLDVILAEPDRSSGLAVLEQMAEGPLRGDTAFARALESQRAALDHDGRLSATMQAHRVVLGFHFSSGSLAAQNGVLPTPLMPADGFRGLAQFEGYGGNLPAFQAAAAGGGFLNALVDPDGVRRRAPLLAVHADGVHGSFALVLARALLGDPPVKARFAAGGDGVLDALEMPSAGGTMRIPVGHGAEVLLPYPSRAGLTRVHSAADVLAGRVPQGALRGRVVLVGATAPGLADLHATPVAEQVAGVHAHANLLTAIIDGKVPHEPMWSSFAEAAMLLAAFLALAPLGALGLRWATLLAAAVALILVAANFAAWASSRLALPLAGPLILVATMFAWRVFYGHFLEARARRRLAALFGQYVPPELVERMSHDPARYDMRGRSAELTVLFADIRGFTALSETLPAADLALLMNEFLSDVTDVVRAHGGTLDKYVGDAVMAFWGAPLDDPAHAGHAIDAAFGMLAALPALNARFAARGWPALALGIGINTGAMVVGDLGSRHRRAYTVLGDAVNVAARLQELCGHYRLPILIGEATRHAIANRSCRRVDTVTLRGRQAPTTVYEPLSPAALQAVRVPESTVVPAG